MSNFIFFIDDEGDTSEIPMENPRCIPKYRAQNFENRSMKLAAYAGPKSRSKTYNRPVLLPSPIVFFAMFPDINSPFLKATNPSFLQKCFAFFSLS